MKYLEGSFSVHPGASKAYRDNWEKVFGKKDKDVKEDDKDKLPAKVPITKELPEDKKSRKKKSNEKKDTQE